MPKRKPKIQDIDKLPGADEISPGMEIVVEPEVVKVTTDYIELRLPIARGVPEAEFQPRRYDVYFDEETQAKGMNALATALRMTGATTGKHGLPVVTKSHVLRWLGQAIYDAMHR